MRGPFGPSRTNDGAVGHERHRGVRRVRREGRAAAEDDVVAVLAGRPRSRRRRPSSRTCTTRGGSTSSAAAAARCRRSWPRCGPAARRPRRRRARGRGGSCGRPSCAATFASVARAPMRSEPSASTVISSRPGIRLDVHDPRRLDEVLLQVVEEVDAAGLVARCPASRRASSRACGGARGAGQLEAVHGSGPPLRFGQGREDPVGRDRQLADARRRSRCRRRSRPRRGWARSAARRCPRSRCCCRGWRPG